MRELSVWTLAIAMLTGGLVALAAGTGASPAGPVTNSDFEVPPFPDELNEPLRDSPIDECIGIGHQVLYGEDTPQGTIAGGTYDDPNPEDGSAQDAADRVAGNPVDEAMFASGYGHCVWGEDTGYDLVWLHPRSKTTQPFHWSYDIRNPPVEFGYNFDDDPFDREVKLLAGDVAHHNLWQWMGSKHQAWTPNADSLSMDVEAGDVSGVVKLTLTNLGMDPASTDYYQPCELTFSQSQLANAMDEDGHIDADPTEAKFNAREPSCQDLQDAWDDENDDVSKRDVLSQTRITQLSFWGWERNTDTDTVLDNIQLPGADTAAEAAAGVN